MQTNLVVTSPREGILTFSMKGLSFGIAGKEITLSCSGIETEKLLSWIAKICAGGQAGYISRDREVYTPLATFEYSPTVKDGRVEYTLDGHVSIAVWHNGDKLSKIMKLSELNDLVEVAASQ